MILQDAPVGIQLAGLGQLQGWTKDGLPIFNGKKYAWENLRPIASSEIEQATKRWRDYEKYVAENPEQYYDKPARPGQSIFYSPNWDFKGQPVPEGWYPISDLGVGQTYRVTHDTPTGTIIGGGTKSGGYGKLEGWTEEGDPIIGGQTYPFSDLGWTLEKVLKNPTIWQGEPWQLEGYKYFSQGPWMDPKYWTEEAKKNLYKGRVPDPFAEPGRYWNFINQVVPEYSRQTGTNVTVPTLQSTKGRPWTPTATTPSTTSNVTPPVNPPTTAVVRTVGRAPSVPQYNNIRPTTEVPTSIPTTSTVTERLGQAYNRFPAYYSQNQGVSATTRMPFGASTSPLMPNRGSVYSPNQFESAYAREYARRFPNYYGNQNRFRSLNR